MLFNGLADNKKLHKLQSNFIRDLYVQLFKCIESKRFYLQTAISTQRTNNSQLTLNNTTH